MSSEVKWKESKESGWTRCVLKRKQVCVEVFGPFLGESKSGYACYVWRMSAKFFGMTVLAKSITGDLETAKAEALRLVREAVKRLADAVGE